jgi:hypothetical protein
LDDRLDQQDCAGEFGHRTTGAGTAGKRKARERNDSARNGLDGLADALKVKDKRFLPSFHFTEEIGGMVKIELK